MKKSLIIFILLACYIDFSFAIDVPQSSKFDSRIQYVNYNNGDVVVVRTLPGIGTRIVFDKKEIIGDIASGFTQGWELSGSRNILYIKPKSVSIKEGKNNIIMAPQAGKWDTNLLVSTNLRLYDFDLKLLPGGSNSGKVPRNKYVAYRIEFKYPIDVELKDKRAAKRAIVQAHFEKKPPPRNMNYTMQIGEHSEGIAPTMAYDDGLFTYLKFPNNREFPSVFTVAADKKESIVNQHVDDDVLVVHRVSKELVLRLGNAVVGIYNDNFDMDGVPPQNGTTVENAKRVFIGDGENHE